jgi:hypothetical protein
MSRRLRGKVCTCLHAADMPDSRDPRPDAKCGNPECGLPIWVDKFVDLTQKPGREKRRVVSSAEEELSYLRVRVVDYANTLLNRALDAKLEALQPGVELEVARSMIHIHAYIPRICVQFYSPGKAASIPADNFPMTYSSEEMVD